MLDIKQIMEILPHRAPFLLVDRIEELEEPVLDYCCEEKADGQATRAIFWHEIASANVI